MKLLICTRADNNTHEMNIISHPLMEQYALRCKADFLVLNTGLPEKGLIHHYKIMKIGELLGAYDRVLHLDTDMIINKEAKNAFDFVPEDTIGTVYEDIGGELIEARKGFIKKIQKRWGGIGWERGYINTGFFMVSKKHKEIFQSYNGQYWDTGGWDDLHLGYMINKHGFKVKGLAFKWNHMIVFSEPWNNCADRFKSHIIHYAGRGIWDGGSAKNKVMQMQMDYRRIYKG